MRWIHHNIKHAYLNLKKNLVYSVLTIAGLTIALTVFIFVLLFVIGELTVDHSFAHHERIFRLVDTEENTCMFDYELGPIINQNYPQLDANCALNRYEWKMVLSTEDSHYNIEYAISTTNDFFQVFNMKFISRMSELPFPDKACIVLTESTAKQLFGDQDPLGQMIDVDRMFKVRVTAIIEDFPDNSSFKADCILNAEDKEMRFSTVCNNGDCYNPMSHYVKLKEGINENDFIENFNATITEHQSRFKKLSLENLSDVYLSKTVEDSENRAGNSSFIQVISLIAIVILILALINYINFSLSLQFSKLKEISIKKVHGASNKQLFFYYLSETSQVMILVMILSILLISFLRNSLFQNYRGSVDLSLLTSPLFLGVFLLVIIFIILINSIVPIYSLFKLNIIDGINGSIRRTDKSILKTILTMVQFTASIILLVAVIVIVSQLHYLQTKDLGFQKENLLKIEIPWKFEKKEALKQEIDRLSFVESSSLSNGAPGQINMFLGAGDEDDSFMLSTIFCDSNYLETFKIKLIDGRKFLKGDLNKVCLMNETAFQKFGWEDLENRRFENGIKGGLDVIGITNDFNTASLHSLLDPVCIIFSDRQSINTLSVRLSPGNLYDQMDQIKEAWESVAADETFVFEFYDTFFDHLYKKEQQLAKSISLLALIALLLTCMGIMGQVMQTCIHKTKEIGIRKVNGASIAEIMQLLNMDFVKWVALSFVFATPIAYFSMNKWLENFAYKIDLSWWIFLAAGFITLLVALITVSWQTFRAARKNPVEALRYE